jgi:lipoate-protein ligase A
MITSIALYEGVGNDPYYNLAVEQHLLETVKEGQCILYLWQNQNTVVIGRNQNPWKECRTTLLAEEGGHLARRLSGGGAVFHDLGNLNFTFLVPQEDYDLERQLTVIQEAVRSMGIPAEKSGRNDILSEGRKFSGNAFFKHNGKAYHHGTLLVDVDMGKLSRYLNPSKAKLQSKGVDSVRSRVVNLKELNPDLTIESLKAALLRSFGAVYGCEPRVLGETDLNMAEIQRIAERNRSWEWNFGAKMPFTCEFEDRFPWGGIQIQLNVENGMISQAKIYSDSMDWSFVAVLEKKLAGCRFQKEAVAETLQSTGMETGGDILNLLFGE